MRDRPKPLLPAGGAIKYPHRGAQPHIGKTEPLARKATNIYPGEAEQASLTQHKRKKRAYSREIRSD
ncbi:hypothetical protein Chor_008609 [Crotalus horridus]